ncbi:MAG: pentapeptide repeat-containing protein [Flavobacteriales bacterium]
MNCFDQHIDKLDAWAIGTYENCHFTGLDFKGVLIKGAKFIDCHFLDCDLSNISVAGCSFQEVNFQNCKLQGILFEAANPFGFECHFQNCLLRHATFYQINLQQCSFQNCDLTEADFTEVKAQGVAFKDCLLSGTVFENADLRKSDFTGSQQLVLSPELNQVKGMKINQQQLVGLLLKYQLEITS